MTDTKIFPGTLAEALQSPDIAPGDRLLLRAGTFAGDFVCTLEGTSAKPIQIIPYPGENPVIDGSILLNGKYIKLMNNGNSRIRHTFSGWGTRQSAEVGSAPTDIIKKNLDISGEGCAVINCVLDNLWVVGANAAAPGGLMYGNLIQHIGWMGADAGHGHDDYSQNIGPTRQIHKRNIYGANFGYGGHFYTQGGHIDYLDIVENMAYRNGSLAGEANQSILCGGYNPPQYPNVSGNLGLGVMQLGYINNGADHVTCVNNYCIGGLIERATVQYDVNSGNYWGPDIGNQAFVFDNEYMSGGGFVTIFNEALSDSVVVDISQIAALVPGSVVLLRNSEDFYNDIQQLTISGDNTITVNMQAINRTVATPVQWTAPATTFPQFGCFVVEKAA